MNEYELVVIGSGVGLSVLSEAVENGLKCALVEDGKMGGTCLTRGCIPSKILIYPADVIRQAEHARVIGVNLKVERVDWKLIAQRMWSQINESNDIEKSLASAENLDVYHGVGEFTGNYEMRVKLNDGSGYSKPFKGKKFVIASGARSFIPPIEGIEDVGYITNETFFGDKFPDQPYESLIIVGGGVIAAEFAHMFS
ncbi:MAG TPA: FAD-dependent oxidoreductase, partial [Candidatus Lokiarchaeia archaeon]|nr:FAD-dependent oxidoreductase [Candidatus Lokiarchaeia archaeon]